MTVRRLPLLVAILLLACVAAPAVHAKDGVRATLISPIDLDARPGERIRIEWKLEVAKSRPFGAGGLFVRLRSATGGKPVTAVTDGYGRFAVQATVPEGGIGKVEFGLQGWRTAGGRTSRAEVLFPLSNDPFARAAAPPAEPARAASTGSAQDDRFAPWLLILAFVGVTAAIVGAGIRVGEPSDRSRRQSSWFAVRRISQSAATAQRRRHSVDPLPSAPAEQADEPRRRP